MGGQRPAVVFVVAHPDDVAFYMGGTAWLLKEHCDLHVLMASRCERGYPWSGVGLAPPSAAVAATREAEEQACCALLGARLELLGLVDGEIYAEQAVIDRVCAHLTALRPAAVFTHGPYAKPDHAATFLIAHQAMHQAGLARSIELYMTFQDGETYNAPFADCFVDISPVVDRKRALVACHASHHRTPADIEHWIEPNALLGRVAGCGYAEAYTCARPRIARALSDPIALSLGQ